MTHIAIQQSVAVHAVVLCALRIHSSDSWSPSCSIVVKNSPDFRARMPVKPSPSHIGRKVPMMIGAETRAAHWDERYRSAGAESVSWFEAEPNQSLALVEIVDADRNASVIDIGGGASRLARCLVERGYHDVSVLDISQEALDAAKAQLTEPEAVAWIKADLLEWVPNRRWQIWHDRAVFHFLTQPRDRDIYRSLLRRAIQPGGAAIIATFGQTGPTSCSGLPVARYSPEGLVTEIGPGFTPIGSGGYDHVTPAGVTQRFTWAVLRADG